MDCLELFQITLPVLILIIAEAPQVDPAINPRIMPIGKYNFNGVMSLRNDILKRYKSLAHLQD